MSGRFFPVGREQGAAAFMQNLRSALQKHLKSKLTDAGVTAVRFFYA